MNEQYTPTTDEVRQSFVYAESSDFVATVPGTGVDSWARVRAQGDVKVTRVRDGELHKAATAEFDRWLAKRDAEVAAKAWSEGWSARASRGYAHLKAGECVPPPAHINPYRKAVQS